MPQGKGTYGKQVGRPPKKQSKEDVKGYQTVLKDYGLYADKIDGIFGPNTTKADSLFKDYMDKGYSKSQVLRANSGAPHMTDEEWGNYIKYGKDYKKYMPESKIIDGLENY